MCSKVKPTKAHTLPSPYCQLGAFTRVFDLKKHFQDVSGLSLNEIGFRELFWTREKTHPCQPYNEVIVVPESEKLSIFYKRQICETEDHSYCVVAILIKDVLEPDTLQRAKHLVFSHLLPEIVFVPRGHTDQVNGCQCNKNKRKKKGETRSFGCSRNIVNSKVCKFNVIPREEGTRRKKYDIKNKHSIDDPKVEELSNIAADISSVNMQKYAPVAFQNLFKHAQKGTDCTIGSRSTKVFGGMTVVSDYAAHTHRDLSNLPEGAVGILSFKNPNKNETQFHALPHYVSNQNNELGVCFDPGDNSLLLEVAVHEDHASSCLKHPDSRDPSRVALVLYRHACLNLPNHGAN